MQPCYRAEIPEKGKGPERNGSRPCLVEQGTGIEPAFTAWEAVVLPIYEPCVGMQYYSIADWKIQVLFVTDGLYKLNWAESKVIFTW